VAEGKQQVSQKLGVRPRLPSLCIRIFEMLLGGAGALFGGLSDSGLFGAQI
jgi:hypothetical protein